MQNGGNGMQKNNVNAVHILFAFFDHQILVNSWLIAVKRTDVLAPLSSQNCTKIITLLISIKSAYDALSFNDGKTWC
jgi:hypothetical protein